MVVAFFFGTDLQWLLRLLLGTVFVLSGAAKLFQWGKFRDTLAAMEVLPPWLIWAVARSLAPLEIVLGVFHCNPVPLGLSLAQKLTGPPGATHSERALTKNRTGSANGSADFNTLHNLNFTPLHSYACRFLLGRM